jgi:hypothetical protein
LSFREWGAEEDAIAALIVDDDDDEAFDALYLRTLRCAEEEAGGCGEDQRGCEGAEVSDCLAEVLCLLVDRVGIHAGLLWCGFQRDPHPTHDDEAVMDGAPTIWGLEGVAVAAELDGGG